MNDQIPSQPRPRRESTAETAEGAMPPPRRQKPSVQLRPKASSGGAAQGEEGATVNLTAEELASLSGERAPGERPNATQGYGGESPRGARKPSFSTPFATGETNPAGDIDISGMSEETLEEERARRIQPGATIGHYELIRLLGQGGMGAVYLARDNRLGRRVAIKFLHTNDEHQTRRFILEARMTARCGHENIVVIFEADEFLGAPYMVLEFLQGTSLQDMLTDIKGPMAPGRVAELLVPVLRALVCAHAAGIVHRDLKPDNIFVTHAGTVKVLDFGISKVLHDDESMADKERPLIGGGAQDEVSPTPPPSPEALSQSLELKDLSEESASLTVAGSLMGTLPYMAPEQWRAKSDIDAQADVWAMGIILYKMLSGRHPLHGYHGMQLSVVGNYKVPMPSLSEAAPYLSDDLIQVVDKCLMKRRKERWASAEELLHALERFLPGRASRSIGIDECPYAGLAAFQESDADRFFGRDAEVSALVNMIRETPLVGVAGASGAGKSSIVRAGVVPALKRTGENWSASFMRPGRTPLLALADAILPPEKGKDRGEQISQLAKELLKEPGKAGAILRAEARRNKGSALLFVDQFEELFTQGISREEREAFTACLSSIADDASSPTRVVLSLRSDFLNRVGEDRRFLAELTKGLFFLAVPGPEAMKEALEEPAKLAGYTFEERGMVDDMLGHLATTPGALPLLQFAASRLWDARDKNRKFLTAASYQAMGGIAGALASHADNVLQQLTPEEANEAKPLFLRLVTSERTRALVPRAELKELSSNPQALESLVDRLVQARLLVVQTSGGVTTVEIVHESLVTSWPTLKRWLDESGEDTAFLEQLRMATRQWDAKGRSKDLLWRGEAAEEAIRFTRRHRGKLAALQMEYLKAVIEQSRRQARMKRNAIVGGAAVLLCITAAMTFLKLDADRQREVAVTAKVEADRQKEIAIEAKGEADRQRDVAERRLHEIEEKEKARLAAQAEADENAREARAQEARALEEARRAQAEELRRLEEMKKKEMAEAEARLQADRRAQAEEQARIEAEKKRAAEEKAQAAAAERAKAEEKKRAAEAAAEKARKDKERLDAEKAARKARIGAIDNF